MGVLIAIPILGGVAIFQSAVISRIPLLLGTGDLLLLAVIAWSLQTRVNTAWYWSVIGGFFASLGSGLPFGVLIANYLLVTAIALVVRKRVWKIPVLAMLFVTFLGTLVVQLTSIISRLLSGVNLQIVNAFNLITLPSLLLNMLLALPVYFVIADIAGWVYRDELEV